MKLLFVTGSRGEWGYIRPLLRLCVQRGIDYHICATNMHLLPNHGMSVDQISEDGFEVKDRIYMAVDGHNHYTQTKSLGVFLCSFVDVLNRVQPDWIVTAGDRGEQLVAAIAGGYTYTPVAHIQAGELSGNIDGVARHALGKFAHIHFASNEDAVNRLHRLGEEEFRICLVGAPQLDELVQGYYASREQLERRYAVDLSKPYLLVAQHPVTEEYDKTEKQILATIKAIDHFKMPKIWILPNNDAGCDIVRRGLYSFRNSETHLFQNLRREDYLGFMKSASCIIGNSSSGLLEAPTFELPAVNLGRRQAGRVQGKNVVNADFEVDEIVAAIKRVLTRDFRDSLVGCTNPYGDGRSSERILKVLQDMRRDDKLLIKKLTY